MAEGLVVRRAVLGRRDVVRWGLGQMLRPRMLKVIRSWRSRTGSSGEPHPTFRWAAFVPQQKIVRAHALGSETGAYGLLKSINSRNFTALVMSPLLAGKIVLA